LRLSVLSASCHLQPTRGRTLRKRLITVGWHCEPGCELMQHFAVSINVSRNAKVRNSLTRCSRHSTQLRVRPRHFSFKVEESAEIEPAYAASASEPKASDGATGHFAGPNPSVVGDNYVSCCLIRSSTKRLKAQPSLPVSPVRHEAGRFEYAASIRQSARHSRPIGSVEFRSDPTVPTRSTATRYSGVAVAFRVLESAEYFQCLRRRIQPH
jgi:hypothetical protein